MKKEPWGRADSFDPSKKNSIKNEQVLDPRPSGCFETWGASIDASVSLFATIRFHLQFLDLLSGEVWRFLTPWFGKEGGDPFSFS